MTTRSKTLTTIGLTLVGLLLFLSATSKIILLGSFADLEEKDTAKNMERARSAIYDDLANLNTVVGDYAGWDESYRFIGDGNAAFIKTNLAKEIYPKLRINLLMFVNNHGKVVYAKGFDLKQGKELPVPQGLQPHLSAGRPLLRHPNPESVVTGILLLPEGPMLVASRPILTSEYKGPINGALVMGRFLDAPEVEKLAETTHLPLKVSLAGDPQLPPDITAGPLRVSSRTPVQVRQRIPGTITGYALMNDIYGKPAVVVQVDLARTIYRQGVQTITYFVSWFAAFCLAVLAASHLFLGKLALSRRRREETEERYRLLFENSLDAILLATPDGVILAANPEACRIFGRTEEEIRQAGWSGLADAADPRLPAAMAEHALSGRFRGEVAFLRKDGTRFPAEISMAVFRDGSGLERTGVIVRDTTDAKLAAEERSRLETQLRQAQKMEAVGQLAGGVAHDFNNILTAIIGYASLLEMKTAKDDPSRHNLEQILAAADRAAHLTQGLLAFSRKQVINPQPSDLNGIVRGVEKLLARLIGEDIELETSLAEQAMTVMADPGQIDQVLMNLATNARDAMPHGGVLTIETGLVEPGDECPVSYDGCRPGAYALLAVSDSGSGMDEETRAHLFEPFFTTKGVGKGTGLGLAIVYGIVRQHNGCISVESEPGKGSTFRIHLPLAQAAAASAKPDEVQLPAVSGTETVLVAEDNPDVRNITRTVLEQFGYRVIEAVDGKDAVEKFRRHHDEVSLVVMDVVMPKKNGREASEDILRIRPGTKVLFTSGYTADVIHRKGVLMDGINFIHKPAAPQALLRKVREVLDG